MKRNLFLLGAMVFATQAWGQLPVFTDISAQAGIAGEGINYSLAVVDVDRDGWEDLYVGCKNAPNFLYRNNGDGTFTDIAPELGLDFAGNTYTAMWADFDNDGDQDLYLGNFNEPNSFFLNTTAGFIEVADMMGIADSGRCRSVATADVNRDGWLDIYVVNLNEDNAFFLSDRHGGYTDHYFTSMAVDNLVGMAALFFDSDNDGDEDLYLLHDAYQPNRLYINDGTGVFSNQSFQLGAAHSGEGMGVDIADINHDGWMDIYITNNYDGNALLMNDGDGSYTNMEEELELAHPGMGWGVSWFDYNLDGEKDIYMVNNSVFTNYANAMYQNLGDLQFSQVGLESDLDSYFAGAGMAVFDFDQDGDEDIAIANPLNDNSPGVQLLRNDTETGHYLAIQLRGTSSNFEAIGSRITLHSEGDTFYDQHTGVSGYSQQNSNFIYFGLGDRSTVDSLRIQWPSGLEELFLPEEIDLRLIIEEGSSLSTDDTDINDDLSSNVMDLLAFLAEYGCVSDCGDSDQSGDGSVDTVDLLLFLSAVFTGQ